jgi:hypothetical protein
MMQCLVDHWNLSINTVPVFTSRQQKNSPPNISQLYIFGLFFCFRSTTSYTRHGCWSWTEPTNHRRHHMVFLIKTTDNQGPDTLRPFHNSSLFCRAGFFRHPVSHTAGRHNRCLAFLVTIRILCHSQFRPKKHCHK